MPDASVKTSSILTFDISPVEIHAHLIIRFDGVYRWMGVGRAPTSLTRLGSIDKKSLLNAVHQLTAQTGYILLNKDGQIITPMAKDGRGVDRVGLTWSLPNPIRVVLIGLMPAYSLRAGHRLVAELPFEIADQMSLTDGRSNEEKLDALLSNRPELIILLGGVNGGAAQVIKDQVNLIVKALKMLPPDMRPEVVFTGNSHISDYVKSEIEPLAVISIAPNIQPTLKDTDFQPAREIFADVCNQMWLKHYNLQTGTLPLTINLSRPIKNSIEDFTNILAMCENANNECVTIYLDDLATILTASRGGRSTSYQYQQAGKTKEIFRHVDDIKLADVAIWSPIAIQQTDLNDQLFGDTLYPGRLPVTSGDLSIIGGMARVIGRRAWHQLTTKKDFAQKLLSKHDGVDTDLIFIGGARLYNRRSFGQVLLEMLDILEPIGVTNVYLDRDGIAVPMGMMAHMDPIIPVQCIFGNAFTKLATVIAPAFHARDDTKIMKIIAVDRQGNEIVHEIKSGYLFSIPLMNNETIELHINPYTGVNLGIRNDRNKIFTISGSMLGIVVDTRGRPLRPRKDPHAQRSWIKHNLEQASDLDK